MVAAEAKVLNDLGLFDTLQTRFHQDVTTAGLSLDMVGGTITPLQLCGYATTLPLVRKQMAAC